MISNALSLFEHTFSALSFSCICYPHHFLFFVIRLLFLFAILLRVFFFAVVLKMSVCFIFVSFLYLAVTGRVGRVANANARYNLVINLACPDTSAANVNHNMDSFKGIAEKLSLDLFAVQLKVNKGSIQLKSAQLEKAVKKKTSKQ